IFDLSSDDAIDASEASGKLDHGIDAFFENEDRLIVVQTKYESSNSWSEITKFHYDIDRILKGKVQDSERNSTPGSVIASIQDFYANSQAVEFYYITSANFSQVERSKLEGIDGLNSIFYFMDMLGIVERLEAKQLELPDRVRDKWFDL